MDITTVTMIAALATLGVAFAALGVSAYAAYLSKQTGKVLDEMKILTGQTREILLGQQVITIAQARAIDGLRAGVQYPTFKGGLIGGSFDENLAQVLQEHNLQPRMVEEADSKPASPQEPPSKGPAEGPAPEADVSPVSDPGQGASRDASPDESPSRTDKDAS